MDKTHSLTTTWTCECGLENSIIKRSCTKCGKSIPDDTRQHIYEEEIRAHGGHVIPHKKFALIIATIVAVFVFTHLGLVLLILEALFGIVSMLLMWISVYQSAKGKEIIDFSNLKLFGNISYALFWIVYVVIVLIAPEGLANAVEWAGFLHMGWIISLSVTLILSVVLPRIDYSDRLAMRSAVLKPCIARFFLDIVISDVISSLLSL